MRVHLPRKAIRTERFQPLPDSRPTPIDELPAHRCKWPLGDVMARGLTCCGAAAGKGPYCDDHEDMNRDLPLTRAIDKFIKKSVRRMA